MIPVLYRGDEQSFLHNGLGQLTEATSAIVTEVANGKLELEIIYPVSGRLKNSISDHMLIKAKPNSVDEPHVFRIYSHTLDTETQTITISAHSKSNDLGNNLVKNVNISGQTPQQAMNVMKANLVEPTEYDFISDITTTSSTTWTNRNPLNCIAGESGSLVHYWGGEIKRDNRAIYLYRRRGNDKVAVIREGKDLGGVSIEYSTKGMVTKIIPFRTYLTEDAEKEITEYGTPVESQYVGNYPIKYIVAVDYSNESGVTNLQTMNAKASRYFIENNGIDKPNINVNVDLVDLSESPEYEKFKSLENKQLFDTLTIYSKKYDINIEAKVNTLVYDSLGEKNISLDMGSYRTGLIESTERTYMELIGEKEAKLTQTIQTIQVAANGKNRVFRGVDKPTKGMVKNDSWYKPVGDGETMLYRFDGADWKIEKISAGLLGGPLDAENGDVDLINVNVASIVGETSDFVRSNWNAIHSATSIDGNGVRINHTDGSYTRLGADGIKRFTSSDNRNYHYMMSLHTFQFGESSNNARWIQLPNDFKGKSFKVYLAIADSMTATDYTYSIQRFVCTIHPDHTIDYANARIPVIAYKSETKMTGGAPLITTVQGLLIAIY